MKQAFEGLMKSRGKCLLKEYDINNTPKDQKKSQKATITLNNHPNRYNATSTWNPAGSGAELVLTRW